MAFLHSDTFVFILFQFFYSLNCDTNGCFSIHYHSHTHSGSLKTFVYEGVRNNSFSSVPMVDISELVSADIVLTTYDVLKEDLSHDSDRQDGDRHFLRFRKRFVLTGFIFLIKADVLVQLKLVAEFLFCTTF